LRANPPALLVGVNEDPDDIANIWRIAFDKAPEN
jgi:hypothetical protein